MYPLSDCSMTSLNNFSKRVYCTSNFLLMPCTNSTVKRKCVEEYIRQVPLTSFLSKQDIDSVKSYCQNMVWNNIPGGFTTNKPQRGTNAFGDGSGYDEHGVIGKKSELGYYTGAINQSDTTLVTKTEL